MNRRNLQALARVCLSEARTLLAAGCYDGAYYLAGYVVECALKACIAKETKRCEFPDLSKVRESYTHDLGRLVRTAKLHERLATDLRADAEFKRNWERVTDWTEERRYARYAVGDAEALLLAITDPKHGVLRWIRPFW